MGSCASSAAAAGRGPESPPPGSLPVEDRMPPNWVNRTLWTGDNLDVPRLLCASCNRIKGDRPQEYLVARLAELAGTVS